MVDPEEEVTWPPKDPQALELMKKVCIRNSLINAFFVLALFTFDVITQDQDYYSFAFGTLYI